MEKINYQEISFEEFRNIDVNQEQSMSHFSRFLFNGSRRGIIDESLEELSLLMKENDIFASYLKENIHSIFDKLKISIDDRYKKMHKLEFIETYKSLSNYEYGDFYLSTNYLTATIFTKYAAGELCENCFVWATDLKKADIVFEDEEINKIMDRIIQRHEKYAQTEKVVLAVKNVEFKDLCLEGGTEIDQFDFLKEELYETEVDLYNEYGRNVRLSNLQKYKFYMIHESEFLKFIPLFTNIKENEIIELKRRHKNLFDKA